MREIFIVKEIERCILSSQKMVEKYLDTKHNLHLGNSVYLGEMENIKLEGVTVMKSLNEYSV